MKVPWMVIKVGLNYNAISIMALLSHNHELTWYI
jgi:hypothetical protein